MADRVKDIMGKIEVLVGEEIVEVGDIIRVGDLSGDLMDGLRKVYSEDGRFELSGKIDINPKTKDETYILFFKYKGYNPNA